MERLEDQNPQTKSRKREENQKSEQRMQNPRNRIAKLG